MVGDTGLVVPPQKPEALANAWKELLALGAQSRYALGQAARNRAIAHFSLDSVVAQYEALYESVLARKLT
jgi:glycosyltransferase involved in cell wall biosynthesis